MTPTPQLPELPEGYYMEGRLHVTKRVLGADGAPMNTDEVFYAGIFDDPEYTRPSSAVDKNILELNPAGGSQAEASAAVMFPDKDASVVLYVTEVTASGAPAANAPDFTYDVTVDGERVVLEADSLDAYTIITNQTREADEIEETAEETEEIEKMKETEEMSQAENQPQEKDQPMVHQKEQAPKTGDESPLLPMAAALGFSALTITFLLNHKRRKKE